MIYKAEYADENFELFSYCADDDEVITEAIACEKDHGALWDIFEVDENYDVIRTVW